MDVALPKSPRKLLVIDDESDIREMLRDALSPEYDVTIAQDGATGLVAARQLRPELILVDLRMPGMSGLQFCKALRETSVSDALVMVMTGSEAGEVDSFESGADDYVAKPFGIDELRARIRTRLKTRNPTQKILSGNLELDLDRCEATLGGTPIVLSSLEFKLLLYFVRTAGRLVSRAQVLEDNWPGVVVTDRTVDTHVSKLRKAIAGSQFQIHTIYGAGYCWRASTPQS